MNEVQFHEEENLQRYAPRKRVSRITGWVLKTGLAKNEIQAQYILLLSAVTIVFISIILFSGGEETPLTSPSAT